MQKKPSKRKLCNLAIVGAIFLALTLLVPKDVSAHSLSPYIKEYVVYAGDELDDSFSFTNTSEERLDFNIYVSAYNPQDGTFIDDELFITTVERNVSIDAGETVYIKYKMSVPFFHDNGSYFNIVVVEEDVPTQEDSVGFKAGYGLITGVHIVDENGSIKGVFDSFSDIVLSLTEKGLPYISPTVIKYSYTNNSNFVFLPDGEIRIFDSVTNERILKEKLNENDTKVFPNEKYETSFSFDVWDYTNLFHDLKVTTRTYNQFDNNYIERVALIPGFSPIPFIAVGAGLLVVIILLLKVIKKRISSKKSSPKSEE